MSIKTTKPSCSNEPFTLDFLPFWEAHGLDPLTDLITSSVWDVTGGTSGAQIVEGTKSTIFLSDGVTGEAITAKNTIEINGGTYRTCATLYIEVT